MRYHKIAAAVGLLVVVAGVAPLPAREVVPYVEVPSYPAHEQLPVENESEDLSSETPESVTSYRYGNLAVVFRPELSAGAVPSVVESGSSSQSLRRREQLNAPPKPPRIGRPYILDLSQSNMWDIAGPLRQQYSAYSGEQFSSTLHKEWNAYGHMLEYSSYDLFALTRYNLYQFTGFRAYVRSLGSYDEFIEVLHNKLESDHRFRRNVGRFVPGFSSQSPFSYRINRTVRGILRMKTGTSKFHKFVAEELHRIRDEKEQAEKLAEAERQEKEAQRKQQQAAAQEEHKRRQQVWLKETEKVDQESNLRDIDFFQDEAIDEQKAFVEARLEEFCTVKKAPDERIHNLARLGERYCKNAIETVSTNRTLFEQHKKRVLALSNAVFDANTVQQDPMPLSDASAMHLQKINVQHDLFKKSYDDSVQQCIQSEVITTVNHTSTVLEAHFDNLHINNIAHVVYKTSELALKHNDVYDLENSFSFSDLSISLLNVGMQCAKVLSRGILEGIENFSQQCLENLDTFVKDPPGWLFSYVHSIQSAALAVGSLLRYAVEHPNESFNNVRDALATLRKTIAQDPEQAGQKTVAFAVETIGTIAFTHAAVAQIGNTVNILKEVKDIIQAEQRVVQAAGVTKGARQILAPIEAIFSEGSEVAKKADRSAIAMVRNKPELLSIEPSAAKCVRLVAKGEAWDLNGIVHFSSGELIVRPPNAISRPGGVSLKSGMHTQKGFKDFCRKAKLEPELFRPETLGNGVTRVIVPRDAFKNKVSAERCFALLGDGSKIKYAKTLFPERYNDPSVALQEALHIIKNPNNFTNSNAFVGKTTDEIRTFVRLNEQGKIMTIYPLWEQ